MAFNQIINSKSPLTSSQGNRKCINANLFSGYMTYSCSTQLVCFVVTADLKSLYNICLYCKNWCDTTMLDTSYNSVLIWYNNRYVVTAFCLLGSIHLDIQYNSTNKLPQRSGVALTLRPWPIKSVGSEPSLMDKEMCHRLKRDIYVLPFIFSLSVFFLSLSCLSSAS